MAQSNYLTRNGTEEKANQFKESHLQPIQGKKKYMQCMQRHAGHAPMPCFSHLQTKGHLFTYKSISLFF